MGPKPSPAHTIERIDNNGDYTPANCCWATAFEQNRNKRTNRYLTALGRTQTITDWAQESGMNRLTIYYRLSRGWSEESAIFTPLPVAQK
jgi:hypothetical protein